ncbi:butyrate kinase [Abyssisolibacter fermentans]|uniref:butyrate kinase n=1 Tax=Abyssisolibacter fermentans TaxID=1766203 RepID=UPI000836DAC0|nr:butyrate kinase [Abyssisolibacter fermentans]
MKDYTILAINPGSTSTKIAIYINEKEVFVNNIVHSSEELEQFETISCQYEFRKNAIIDLLNNEGYKLSDLSAIVARGGLLPPVKSGAYIINEAMVERLKNRPIAEHASNLAAIISYDIANQLDIPAYIYDSIAVDELEDVARISGMKDIERESLTHMLNMRAAAIKCANDKGKEYKDLNIITVHLGGGISLAIHSKGKVIDVITDDEGPFSPERAGRVPCRKLIDLCYSGKYTKREMKKKLRGKGGLISYLSTNSALEVEKKIANGDENAKLVYSAMAYQIAKGIGELATVVEGEVDFIIITGGIAHSKFMTSQISNRVKFIAPVIIVPGENELQSLTLGALRVLRGVEQPHIYTEREI